MGGCTVFFFKAAGAGPSSPAYVMTAGHCIDLGANDVLTGRPDATRTVQFAPLQKASVPPIQARSRRIAYSTMKEVDIAIVELDSTSAELESTGAAAFRLARSTPSASTAV